MFLIIFLISIFSANMHIYRNIYHIYFKIRFWLKKLVLDYTAECFFVIFIQKKLYQFSFLAMYHVKKVLRSTVGEKDDKMTIISIFLINIFIDLNCIERSLFHISQINFFLNLYHAFTFFLERILSFKNLYSFHIIYIYNMFN